MKNVIIILASVVALALGSANFVAQAQSDVAQTDGLIITLEDSDIQKWVFQKDKLYILLSEEGKGRLNDVTIANIGETLTIKWRTHTIVSAQITGPVSSGRLASSDPSAALLSDLESQIETQVE